MPLRIFENFTPIFSYAHGSNVKAGCIIMPNAKWKVAWDFFIVILLLWVSIVVPFRLAFYDQDNKNWFITYTIVDCFFLIDIILSFFTALVDESEIITKKSEIARRYLKFWFWIDLVSILPLDLIEKAGMNFNAILRFAKIGKLYKLIRLSRLAKLFKLLKR